MNKLISINPSTYSVLGNVSVSSNKDIVAAVKSANIAKKEWKTLGLKKRIVLLRKVLEKISQNKEHLAKLATKEMGMPITQTRAEIESAMRYFTWYLDNALKYLFPEIVYEDEKTVHTVFYEPLGVAAVITPWNFPLSNFIWGAGQNLVVGNCVIYKTSEEITLFAKLLEKIIKSAGLPEGVFTEVFGDGKVGDFLVHQDINLICFTGSTKIGQYLYQVAGEKFIKAVMELGGSAPGIVFPDANLNLAVTDIYGNRFVNCGQMCDALKRLIVHEKIFDNVVARLQKHIASVKVGNPEDEATDIGPLVAKRQLELLEEQVKDAVSKGAKIIIGGRRLKNAKGAFYEPTILTNITRDMRVWQEEVFGPVLPILSFRTEEEAIRLANDTKYGLGAYVYTKDAKRAQEIASQIDSGMVSVNGVSYVKPCSPFGGYKYSGIGREHGKFGFADLTQVKVVAREK